MKHLYWLLIPLGILGFIFAPKLLELPLPVPENQKEVESILKQMYGNRLKVKTISNSQSLPANTEVEDSIYNYMPFEIDGTIVGYQFLTNAVEQVHHFNVYDEAYQHPLCRSVAHKIIYATGGEMSPTYYLNNSGYLVDGELMGEIMWFNETSQAVYARMELKVFYVEQDLKPVIPALIDVKGPCSSNWFEVEGDVLLNSVELETEIEVKQNFKIMTLGGHCHENCEYISLLINGKPSETFYPEYEHGHHPTSIEPRISTIHLTKGDKVGVEVSYKDSHKQIDAMGMIMMILQ